MNEKRWLWTAVIGGAMILGVIFVKQNHPGSSTPWTPGQQQQQSNQPVSGWAAQVKQAKESGKQLFVYFGRADCNPCQRMKSEVLPNSNVQAALNKYVVCIFDVNQEPAMAQKFGVSVLPTMLIVDGNEQVQKTVTGYMAADQFIQWLGGQVAPPSQADPQRNNPPSPTQPQRRRSSRVPPGNPGAGPAGPGCGPG